MSTRQPLGRWHFYLFLIIIGVTLLQYTRIYRWVPKNDAMEESSVVMTLPEELLLHPRYKIVGLPSRNVTATATATATTITSSSTVHTAPMTLPTTPPTLATTLTTYSSTSDNTTSTLRDTTFVVLEESPTIRNKPHFANFQRFLKFPSTKELQSSCPPRLEFLHIPKAGGTTIEKCAFQQANIAWGCCHFHLNYAVNQSWDICPPHLNTLTPLDQWPSHQQLMDLWHYPLHWLTTMNHTMTMPFLPSNPYHNLPMDTPQQQYHQQQQQHYQYTNKNRTCPPDKQELHFFAVMRNPYTRAISEFYYKAGFTFANTPHTLQNPKILNIWIKKRLNEYKTRRDDPHGTWNGRSIHWIPQSEYIFDSNGQRMVHHVLKFENLTAEFSELVQRYNINVSLYGYFHKSGPIPASSRLGPHHLSVEVRTELEHHFGADFILGNYSFYRPSETLPELQPT